MKSNTKDSIAVSGPIQALPHSGIEEADPYTIASIAPLIRR